jgi:hypothetical protein
MVNWFARVVFGGNCWRETHTHAPNNQTNPQNVKQTSIRVGGLPFRADEPQQEPKNGPIRADGVSKTIQKQTKSSTLTYPFNKNTSVRVDGHRSPKVANVDETTNNCHAL